MSQFAQRDQLHENADGGRASDDRGPRAPGRRTRTEGLTRRGGGQPLPGALRAELEPAIGSDLGDVRLHTGPEAAADAEQLDARAFAIGQDVHFGAGQYTPESAEGRQLIAHEVAHTVQQRGAPEAPACAPLEVSQPGDRWEAEADAFADAFGNLAPHTVSPGSAASVARVHLAPKGGPTAKGKSDDAKVDVHSELITQNLDDAACALGNATLKLGGYAAIVDQLVKISVEDVADSKESNTELDALREAIKEKGRPDFIHMLLDLAVGAVALTTGIGEVVEAFEVASTIAVIAKGSEVVGTIHEGVKAVESPDVAVDQRVAANIAMLNQHIQHLNDSMMATDALLGLLIAALITSDLRTAATKLGHAATGMAQGGKSTDKQKESLAAIVASNRAIKIVMNRFDVLLEIGNRLGFEKIAHGTQARTLIEFLAEREKAGELGQIILRRPQNDVVVGGFQWGGTPKRPVSGFHFSQFGGRFGHRIDGGKKWLPQLLTFGLIPNGTNPESPTELTLEDKMAEAVMLAFSGLGVKEEAPSKVHVNLPSGTIELPIGSSQFWENPKFGELYDRELQHPEGYRVYALYVQYPDGEIERHQPHWLTARLDEDND